MTAGNNTGKRRTDWLSVGIFFLLMVLGWLNIYAAVFDESGAAGFDMGLRYGSQLKWMGICAVVALVIMLIDDIYYHIAAYPAYWLMIALLFATIFIGSEINGAKSWIKLGGFSIQPAEFAKFTTALALARYMSSYNFSLENWRKVLVAGALVLLPAALIMLQNDTGSAVVYAAFLIVFLREGANSWLYVSLGMVAFLFIFSFLLTPPTLLWCAIVLCVVLEGVLNGGWKKNVIFIAAVALSSVALFGIVNVLLPAGRELSYYWCLFIVSVISAVVAGLYAWRNKLRNVMFCVVLFAGSLVFTQAVDYVFENMMQVHQQKRILNLLGIESDIQKWGYNVNQSKIAIGSGGLWGKGYLQGTQTKYDFVPEQSTDFIFCTVGEEWGFVGSTLVLVLFCWLIIRLIRMGERQQETFGRVYCYGVASIIFFHVIVNVGMTIGIMPVIGIPLPLFSYGGSSLLAFTILFFVAVKLDSRKRSGEEYGVKQ